MTPEQRTALRHRVAETVSMIHEGEALFAVSDAAINLIRAEVLEEVASPTFLQPLIEEQSKGEWDDKTINEDVQMFSAAIRALKDKP